MKLLHISSVYDELIKSFEYQNPDLENLNYDKHFNKFINYSRGQEFSYSYYLKNYGIETEVFYINYTSLSMKYSSISNNNRKNFTNLNLLENKIEDFKPDIIYIQNTIFFKNQDILNLKKKFPFIKFVISWICTPLRKEILSVIDSSDLILTCSKEYFKDLIQLHQNVLQINHAFDERNYNHLEFDKKIFDVSFYGSIIVKKGFHINRLNILNEIISEIKQINICGQTDFDYKEVFNIKNFINYYQIKNKIKLPVYGIDYFKMVSNSKICINTHADNQEFSGNMRLFDVTGQGTLLLTDKNKDSKDFFISDTECVEFENAQDAIEKINWLLKNPKKLIEIAENGRKKTLEFFSYKNRCEIISKILNDKLC